MSWCIDWLLTIIAIVAIMSKTKGHTTDLRNIMLNCSDKGHRVICKELQLCLRIVVSQVDGIWLDRDFFPCYRRIFRNDKEATKHNAQRVGRSPSIRNNVSTSSSHQHTI